MSNGKQGAALALGGAAILAFLLARKGGAEPPPEEGGIVGADLEVLIVDKDGNILPHNSPVVVQEGETYQVRPRITNTSYRLIYGEQKVPIPATFGIGMVVNIGTWYPPGLNGIQVNFQLIPFDASEQKTLLTYPSFTVPYGTSGQTGRAYVEVYDPNGNFLKSGETPIEVMVAPTVWDVIIEF